MACVLACYLVISWRAGTRRLRYFPELCVYADVVDDDSIEVLLGSVAELLSNVLAEVPVGRCGREVDPSLELLRTPDVDVFIVVFLLTHSAVFRVLQHKACGRV